MKTGTLLSRGITFLLTGVLAFCSIANSNLAYQQDLDTQISPQISSLEIDGEYRKFAEFSTNDANGFTVTFTTSSKEDTASVCFEAYAGTGDSTQEYHTIPITNGTATETYVLPQDADPTVKYTIYIPTAMQISSIQIILHYGTVTPTGDSITTEETTTTTTTSEPTTTTVATTTTSTTTTTTTETTTLTTASGITTSTTITTITTNTTTEETPIKYMLGDVNQDHIINVGDAFQVLQASTRVSAGMQLNYSEQQILSADVNTDGKITVADAFAILLYTSYVSSGKNVTWEEVMR